jgi:16S rRNA G966 N2-methylase RsmD
MTKDKTIGWKPMCKCLDYSEFSFGDYKAVPCTVLDPFAGSGTTGAVALELGRKAILIELNPKYVELIRKRCSVTPGLALA